MSQAAWEAAVDTAREIAKTCDVTHEFSEPYGHDIRIGIFEKLRNALLHTTTKDPEEGR